MNASPVRMARRTVCRERSTVAPGASPGVLNVTSDLTSQSGSTFEVELLGTLAGEYDQLPMSSGATFTAGGGPLSVAAPNPLMLGFVFPVVIGWGPIAPSMFAGLSEGATFSADANVFQIHYGTLSGHETAVTRTVIPEPSPMALLGKVAAAVPLRRRLR